MKTRTHHLEWWEKHSATFERAAFRRRKRQRVSLSNEIAEGIHNGRANDTTRLLSPTSGDTRKTCPQPFVFESTNFTVPHVNIGNGRGFLRNHAKLRALLH